MLTRETSVSVISPAAEASADNAQEFARQQRLMQAMPENQQAKYLHLREETELLLQQLQAMKRQREGVEERQLVGTGV